MRTAEKSVAAGILISIGVYGLFAIENNVVSAVLFSLGLLTICVLGLNLFTGKCGFIFETKQWKELFIILIANLVSGYLMGLVYSTLMPGIVEMAQAKVDTWSCTPVYFVKAMLCGAIMYFAVKVYKKGSTLGILLGVPMFILCGFQHCIANVVTMGIARTFSPALLVAIVGNFAGSVVFWYVSREEL